MNILYISYDGMTDPLGQSQVLPYLQGLSAKGYKITLISFEKKQRFLTQSKIIQEIVDTAQITWVPKKYTSFPPVISTLYDLFVLKSTARKVYKNNPFQIVHCRSYITSLIGLWLKRKFDVKFVFDMRGFWADERVDGKIWNRSNPVFNSIYKYFKRKEKEFLMQADAVISLTNAGKDEIISWNILQKPNIHVIPCCADLDFFKRENVSAIQLNELRTATGIKDSDYVVSYLGSVGTWYMLNEMLDFFKVLLSKNSNALFLFITGDNPETLIQKCSEKNIPDTRVKIISAKRSEVPAMILLSKVSLFFILPVFSKKASSPTKMGEIMGMGIPVICNSNVGDDDLIINNTAAGLLVKDLNTEGYQCAIQSLSELESLDPQHIRNGAFKYFSLQQGIKNYDSVYTELLKK